MEFSFGIVTIKGNEKLLKQTIKSIEEQKIKDYEIIVVGGDEITTKNDKIYQIPFDETFHTGWLTKKKNIITKMSKYENIVYTHDYLKFEKNWYEGYLKFGNNFKVCMNKIVNKDGKRYRDWVLWPHNDNKVWNEYFTETRECLIPYEISHLSKYMYISGAYWVAKADFMNKHQLDESLVYLDPEDVEWSQRVREETDFKMNLFSTVKLLRQKDVAFKEATSRTLEFLESDKY